MAVSITAMHYGEINAHSQLEAHLSIPKPPREASELWCRGRTEAQAASL